MIDASKLPVVPRQVAEQNDADAAGQQVVDYVRAPASSGVQSTTGRPPATQRGSR